jgi:hypothetical protein
MKLSRWLFLLSVACTGGSSSSGAETDGALFVVEGLGADNKLAVCVADESEFSESFVVRNVSNTKIAIAVSSEVRAGQFTISKPSLEVGESATVTMSGTTMYLSEGGFAGLSATPATQAVVPQDGTVEAPPPKWQSVSVAVRFEVDDRAYTLGTDTGYLFGGQPGHATWTTRGGAALPPPRITVDGPFVAGGTLEGNTSKGAFGFHIAKGGVAGEEVTGTMRVAPLRCSQKSLPESPPVTVKGRRSIVATQIATGLVHSCALDAKGRAFCWGDDAYGQLGQPIGALQGDASAAPLFVEALGTGVGAIAAGRAHTCALRAGDVLCWGDSSLGQCGPDVVGKTAQPTKVTLGVPAKSVVARGDRSCASLTDGRVTCWGRDAAGTGKLPPTPLPSTTGALQIALGDAHVCIRSDVGSVLCSGAAGRIGDGTTTASSTPVQILTDVTDIAAGAMHTCAATKLGTLVCWGDVPDNGSGTTPVLTPQLTPVGFSSELVLRVAAAGRTTCTMGMGITCTDYTELPEQERPSFSMFDTGGAHVCAIFDGGKVTCFGNNARRQTGLGESGSGIYGFDGP